MKNTLLLLALIFPLVVQAVPVELSWDANPVGEEVVEYNVYKNDEATLTTNRFTS